MAIVSEVPFELQLIKHFPRESVLNAEIFFSTEKEVWKTNIVTLSTEENEDIEILFNTEDKASRLYLDALDIMPLDDKSIKIDEDGRIYRIPSANSFILYEGNSGYDALRVDTFKMSVFCYNTWYYGTFQILPKPMTLNEWGMMKDDLEKEIRGLAQDIVRRNIGLGGMRKEAIPPKILYDFFVMKRYSKRILASLMDIAENPKSEVITVYENMPSDKGRNYTFDSETIKRYVSKSGADPVLKIPIKDINYDIQDNRLLKMIIQEYEKRLDQFIELLDLVVKFPENTDNG